MISESSLLRRTRELLHDRPRHKTVKVIAAATGLNEQFIASVGARRHTAHDVNGIVKLYEYLSGSELAV